MTRNNKMRPLYEHQRRAIYYYQQAIFEGHTRVMLMAPTGFGKTLTAAHIINHYLQKGKNIVFTVPKLILVDKTVEDFSAEGIDFGVIQGDHYLTDHTQQLQIASIQSLARRKIQNIDVFIIDEAHLIFKSLIKLMKDFPNAIFLGLSATPWTSGLGKLYSKQIIAATSQELIDQNYLSKFIVYAPTPEPNLSNIKTVRGEYDQHELCAAIDTRELVGDIIQTWMKRAKGLPTLCFGVNRQHAKHIQELFLEAGEAAEYIDCFTDDNSRRRIINQFKSGHSKVICNVGVLTAGFDADVRCIIDARPTKSEMLYVQTLGRCLRTAVGKAHSIILDHAGNALRLGLITDIFYEDLDPGYQRNQSATKKRKKTPLPRLCQECKSIIPYHAEICPQCGYSQVARSTVIVIDGELVEYKSGINGNKSVTLETKIIFMGELKHIALDRGFAPGWISHKFKERFGSWPNDPKLQASASREPSLATKNWIKSKAIAYAKATRANG